MRKENLDWPMQSLDLNPIENVWKELKIQNNRKIAIQEVRKIDKSRTIRLLEFILLLN